MPLSTVDNPAIALKTCFENESSFEVLIEVL